MNEYSRFDETPAVQELSQLDQWVTWKREANDVGNITKIPYDPKTGYRASSTDPATWSTHAQAVAASKLIGFVFSSDDPYSGVDLDDCYDPATQKLTPEAQEIVDLLSSYTEISPSGSGVKIFCRGILPSAIKHSDGFKIEVYSTKRFFTVTNQHFSGSPETIEHRQGELDLIAERFAPNQPKKGRGKASLTEITNALDDHQVGWRLVETTYGTIAKLDTCLTSDDHDDGAYFTLFPNGTAQYACYHNSCSDKRWSDAAVVVGLNPDTVDPLPSSDEANAERLIALHG